MKDLNKYLFEEYTDTEIIENNFIKQNIKNNKKFNKFIKICMKYKIYLFHKVNDKYELRSNKSLCFLINKKKSEIIAELGKMILKLHNFDKYLETSTSDNFTDVYDTKNRIDILYKEFDKNYRYLEELVKMLNNDLKEDVLLNYIFKENHEKDNKLNNNVIEEFSNN